MHKITRLFLSLILLSAVSVQSQNNTFLDREYWKKNPNVAQVKSEIEKGSDPAQFNSNAFDATVYAILEGASKESVQFLLGQKGNDVNKITHDGRTYIFWAAYKGNTELMQYLIDKGAKTNLLDDKGYSILNFAASAGQQNTAVYDLCLKHGADLKKDVDHEGANALLLSIASDKDFALTNYFVSKGLDLKSVDANGNSAFNYAARSGNLNTLKGLLEKGVKFNDNAMIMASQGTRSSANTLEVYQYLESLKIKPTAIGKNGENALHNVVKKEKQVDVIAYFIAKGVDVNQPDKDGNTAFINAASANNDLEIIRLLATKVTNFNQVSKKGVSALALAVRNNSPEIATFLIEKGADVNIVDANGDNLASYLIQSYNPEKTAIFESKIKILQDKKFDIAAPQKNGNTLYHLAAAKNDLTLLKAIARFKTDVNAKNKEGLTPLHKAAMVANDNSILKYLIEIGAKKDGQTEFKETAFDLATENESLKKNKIAIDFLK